MLITSIVCSFENDYTFRKSCGCRQQIIISYYDFDLFMYVSKEYRSTDNRKRYIKRRRLARGDMNTNAYDHDKYY